MDDALLIPLIKNNKINSTFVKANSYILKKYKSEFNEIVSFELKIELLKKFWEDEFAADLIIENITPTAIRFSNKSRMLLFSLNFGD